MPRQLSTKNHPAETYARQAAGGAIVVSKWVRLAAERHLRDLKDAHKRGFYFDPAAAQDVIDFFGFLCHSKGEWGKKVFVLEPWQQFILWVIFGWKRKSDDFRRFRSAYIEIAKKNGKSTLCAGVALYLLFADDEEGAEIYCAATKKDQARIVFAEAVKMRDASPGLKKRIKKFRDNLSIEETGSKLEPLGADSDTLDGPNIHGLILDELHAHKSRAVMEVLVGGTIARRQPMIFKITTAGSDRESVGFTEHTYAERILEGTATDDEAFAYIACLDNQSEFTQEKAWIKANPNLGVSVKIDTLRAKVNKATQELSSRNGVLRFHFNIWTSAETAAIDLDKWNLCAGFSLAGKDAKVLRAELEEQLAGRRCFLAVDLSSTEDLTASVKLFPPEEDGDPYIAIPHFYLPEDNLQKKIDEWRVPYDVWVREGFITATDGDVVDYDVVKAQILADVERYDVAEITFDPWNATQFANGLQKAGIPEEKLVKFPQTIAMYAEPTKQLLEVLIPAKRVAHLGNPVLRWNAANLLVKEDANGNKRPVKKSKRGKIDGIAALLMALGRAISGPSDDGSHSLYSEGRGVFLA